jgi:hypothetical protein
MSTRSTRVECLLSRSAPTALSIRFGSFSVISARLGPDGFLAVSVFSPFARTSKVPDRWHARRGAVRFGFGTGGEERSAPKPRPTAAQTHARAHADTRSQCARTCQKTSGAKQKENAKAKKAGEKILRVPTEVPNVQCSALSPLGAAKRERPSEHIRRLCTCCAARRCMISIAEPMLHDACCSGMPCACILRPSFCTSLCVSCCNVDITVLAQKARRLRRCGGRI